MSTSAQRWSTIARCPFHTSAAQFPDQVYAQMSFSRIPALPFPDPCGARSGGRVGRIDRSERDDCRVVEAGETQESGMREEAKGDDNAAEEMAGPVEAPIDDLFSVDDDQVDFMSAESFPASDPPPPQSIMAPPRPREVRHNVGPVRRANPSFDAAHRPIEIVRWADERGVGLIVMGSRG